MNIKKSMNLYKQFCANIVVTLRQHIISQFSSLFQLSFCLKHYHKFLYFHRLASFINAFQCSGWKMNGSPGCFKWGKGKPMEVYFNRIGLGVTHSTSFALKAKTKKE